MTPTVFGVCPNTWQILVTLGKPTYTISMTYLLVEVTQKHMVCKAELVALELIILSHKVI